jgi:hypothetical protein
MIGNTEKIIETEKITIREIIMEIGFKSGDK